jgi:hypothetical protein
LFKRALKYVGAAALLLCPTLAGVVAATPAFATTYTNDTFINDAHLTTYFTTVAPYTSELDVVASFDPAAAPGESFQDHLPGAIQASGGSATLYLKGYMNSGSASCTPSSGDPDQLRVEIHGAGGTQVGGTDWTIPWSTIKSAGCNLGGFTNVWSASTTVYFDGNPLDGDNLDGTLAPGAYSLYLAIDDSTGPSSNLAGMTTTGGHGTGPDNDPEETSVGTFTVSGLLNGFMTPTRTETGEVETQQCGSGNHCFGSVRVFKSSWADPGTSTSDAWKYGGEGKAVLWSVVPPAWSGTCGVWTSGGGCPNGGTSSWSLANSYASSSPSGVTMRSEIQNLENIANQAGGPSFVTISITHEPHDQQIDSSNGWDGGSGNRKCGGATDPAQVGGKKNETCLGTAAQYLAMYTTLRQTRDNSCDASGGTTGTGHACTKVKIQYIGVPSNMYPQGSLTGSHVGDGDPMRPNSADYDILGGDPYNYGCFDNATGNCGAGDGGWKTFQQTVDDTSASLDRAGTNHLTLLGLGNWLGKRIILDEVGSHPGCNAPGDNTFNCNNSTVGTSRSTWMSDAYTYMTTNATFANFVISWNYFHEFPSGVNDWRFLDFVNSGGTHVIPDSRGKSAYTSGPLANASFLKTANGYILGLTP